MKQAVKATVLVLFVSLLSGCSSAEAKACEAAKQAKVEFEAQRDIIWTEYQKNVKLQGFDNTNYDKAYEQETNARRTIVNNQNCFTPKEVAEAQTYLSKVK
jgi:uncharacterized protein YceK